MNAIAPGYFCTDLTARFPDEFLEELTERRIPLGHLGNVDDYRGRCGPSQPASAYVTGVVLPVDGGFLLS